jgi:nitrile hydratase
MGTATQKEYRALRAKAIESLMIEKGVLTEAMVDTAVSTYENEIGPMRGARVVAHAWVDPEYRQRLLDDATSALRELGIEGFAAQRVVAVENTPEVHNMIVCTLCSCYPWAVLGLPPRWFKSPEYRGRVVREPRGVLQDFGVELPERVEVRVWDSSSEVRYMVVPERPAGTEELSEEQLAELVTRDSMIGTGLLKEPGR